MRNTTKHTIKDIAKELGIAPSTVSYALNNGPRQISPEVKERVWKVAERMGYQRNEVAHALVSRRTRMIGVVGYNMGEGFFNSPYNQTIATTLMAELERESYDARFVIRHDPHRYARLSDAVLGGRCDAALILDGVQDETILSMAKSGLPLICLAHSAPEGVACYSTNPRQGLREALGHLYHLGHRDFAYLHGSEELGDARDRLNIFLEFAAEFAIEVKPHWILQSRFTFGVAAQCVHRIWSHADRPTALVCGNDEAAMGAMVALSDIGVRVPEDVSVVGFDDVFLASQWQPGITTVRQPIQEMVQLAAKELILAAETNHKPESRTFATELVVRASTAKPKFFNRDSKVKSYEN